MTYIKPYLLLFLYILVLVCLTALVGAIFAVIVFEAVEAIDNNEKPKGIAISVLSVVYLCLYISVFLYAHYACFGIPLQ
jgi:hypothetical protein